MTERVVTLADKIAPTFHDIHRRIKQSDKTRESLEIWLKGGRGSCKSSTAAIEVILGVMKDPEANGIAFRKIGDTVRTSILQTLLWAVNKLEVHEYWRHTKSPAELIYIPTGQKILCKGLDDPLKMKSIKLEKGYFKFLWFEEAAEYNGIEEIRNVEQSVLRGGDAFVEFLTYNPPNDPAAWVNKESTVEKQGRVVHTSSYLDISPEWLGDKFVRDAEWLREADPVKYAHEYLGEAVGRAEQIVFHGKYRVKEFDTPPPKDCYENRYFYGLDFGFANDPNALVRAFIKQEGEKLNLYVDREVGGVGIELDDMPAMMDAVPEVRRWKVKADCARPETIAFLAKRGYNIEAAAKWQGSVEDGIEYLKSFGTIFVHPRCVQLADEMSKYSYKVDRHTKEILPVVVDKWNNYIDALRYALSDYIKSEVSILDVL